MSLKSGRKLRTPSKESATQPDIWNNAWTAYSLNDKTEDAANKRATAHVERIIQRGGFEESEAKEAINSLEPEKKRR
jgi:hypothetical protein